MQSYPIGENCSRVGNFREHSCFEIPVRDFLLFDLEYRGRWVNKCNTYNDWNCTLFTNRYQREKAIEELFQADLIALAFPPCGYHVITLLKFEPLSV